MLWNRVFIGQSAAGASYWVGQLGNTNSNEFLYGLALSSAALYVTGQTNATGGAGGNDALLAKLDPANGDLTWVRSLGGSGSDTFYRCCVDSSDNLHIAGVTASQGAGSSDVVTAQYNTSGAIQWQRLLGSTGFDAGYSSAVDTSGNVYMHGLATITTQQAVTAKYNASGTLQWQRALGSVSFAQGRDVALNSSADVYVVGNDTTNSNGIYLAKYNTSGTLQWQRSLASNQSGYGTSVAVDSSGNVYVLGKGVPSGSTFRGVLAKYNSSGAIQWQRQIYAVTATEPTKVAVDPSGNVYIAGSYTSGADGVPFIAKYNSSGALQWQRTFTSSAGVFSTGDFFANIQCNDSDIYVGLNYFASSFRYALVVKLPNDGSRTGTYGAFTYAASTLTEAAGTFAEAANSMTGTTPTLTAATATLTDASRTLTYSKTNL